MRGCRRSNGVVRTLTTVVDELRAMGHVVEVIGPDRFRTIPCPTYSDIPLVAAAAPAVGPPDRGVQAGRVAHRDRGAAGHGGAELGEAYRLRLHHRVPYALRRIRPGADRPSGAAGLRLDAALPRCGAGHDGGDAIACATNLTARGFRNIRSWSRGVDLTLFKPEPREQWDLPRPIFLYVGRVAVEKNIGAFLDLDLPGSKVVVGGGPILARCSATIRRCCSPGRATARRWRAPMPAPTCSCSLA